MFDEAAKRHNFQFLLALWCALLGGAISFVSHPFFLTSRIDQYFLSLPPQSFIAMQFFMILPTVAGGAIFGGWVGWRIAPWLSTSCYRYWILAILPSLALIVCILPSLVASPQSGVPHNLTTVPQAIAVGLLGIGAPFGLRHRGII